MGRVTWSILPASRIINSHKLPYDHLWHHDYEADNGRIRRNSRRYARKKKKRLFCAARVSRLFTLTATCPIYCRTIQKGVMQTQHNVHWLWRDNVKFINNNYGCVILFTINSRIIRISRKIMLYVMKLGKQIKMILLFFK